MNADTATITRAVEAVLLAFTVVVSVALERFFSDHLVEANQKYKKQWQHELFYWMALTILVTLAIRFLVGSSIHLHATYTETPTFKTFLRLLKDLFFLFAFGAFLVRAALAKDCKGFLLWLMLFSAFGVYWSVIEVITRPSLVAWNWVSINLAQFVVACIFFCVFWCEVPPKLRAFNNIRVSFPVFMRKRVFKNIGISFRVFIRKRGFRNIRIFVSLLFIFVPLFGLDLWQLLVFSGRGPRDQTTWRFAVSGDSRNCGDVVMPAIARSVRQSGAEFYWHLGDLRFLYNLDEDMAAEQRRNMAINPKLYPLSIPDYEARAWDNVEANQIAPFGPTPFFIGIGNHELVWPKTRAEFVSRFRNWLGQPVLQAQRLADNPGDPEIHTYYHWVNHGVDFVYLDNASDTIDDPQMQWLEKVLTKDIADEKVRAVVVGMHEALPESQARSHSMSDSDAGQRAGLRVYDHLRQIKQAGKPVYILASHSHFFLANAFDTQYWRDRKGVLPGWIVGSAGAERYTLPDNVKPSRDAQTDVYGYLLVTVRPQANGPEIIPEFVEVKEQEVPDEVAARYPAGFVHWCFSNNSKTHRGPPPP